MVKEERPTPSPELSKTVRRETEFPSDLEGRVNALLVSVIPTTKAVTLLLIPPVGYIPPSELDEDFERHFRGTDFSEVHRWVARAYAHTLCSIGMVAEELSINYFGSEVIVGYVTTQAGERYGKPAVALALSFEKEQGVCLFESFGSTQSPSPEGYRAPHTRASILKFLAQQERQVRALDVSETLNLDFERVSTGLISLSTAGLINYESVLLQRSKASVAYGKGTLQRESVHLGSVTDWLTKAVVEAVEHLIVKKAPITQDNVFWVLPGDRKAMLDEASLRIRIDKALSNLADQHYLERGRFRGAEVYTAAQITGKGEIVVSKFLEPLYALASDSESLDRIQRKLLPQVMKNIYAYAETSAALYYPHSQAFKKRQAKENRATVLERLGQAPPEGLSAIQLVEGLRVKKEQVYTYIQELRAEGYQIERAKAKRHGRRKVTYYRLLSEPGKASLLT